MTQKEANEEDQIIEDNPNDDYSANFGADYFTQNIAQQGSKELPQAKYNFLFL